MIQEGENEARLAESDVRQMVRLLGEVAVTPGGVNAQKRKVMEGLSEMLGADYWMWNISRLMENGTLVGLSLVHNLSEEQMAAMVDMNYATKDNPYNMAMIEQCRRQSRWSRRLEDMLDQSVIPEAFRAVSRRMDMEYSLFGFQLVPGTEDLYSAMGLHRAPGKAPFTLRELRIAHILYSEVRWLHEVAAPEEDGSAVVGLAPRLQTVMTLLVDGQSAKRIALHLGLSIHTVRGYIKDVYRHFGVSSRTELMHRFMVGDGRDRVP